MYTGTTESEYVNSTTGTGNNSKVEWFRKSITFTNYAIMAKLEPSIRGALAQYYVGNVLNCGGLPSFRKAMVVTLAEITAVFPGFPSLLPPLPDGGTYAPDIEFVVWLTTPNSKAGEAYIHGSLFPMAKPRSEWETDARNGSAFTSPSSTCWTPFVLMDALINNPIQLLGLRPNSSEAVVKVRVSKALRNATWPVRRMLLLIPMYRFIQSYVVQPAFKHFNEDRLKHHLGGRYDNITVLEGLDFTVSTTDMIVAYCAYIKDPDGGTYVPLLKQFHGAYDRYPGYQAHSFDSGNKATYFNIINNPRKNPRDSPLATPGYSTPGSNPALIAMFGAGAAARSVVSPGKPGTSKSMRGYVDVVNKGKVAAAALTSGGTPNPAASGTPAGTGGSSSAAAPAAGATGPPANGSMATPINPGAVGVSPGPAAPGAMGPGFPGPMGPGFPGFPGFSPYQGAYMAHPGYNPMACPPPYQGPYMAHPWATPPTQ